jgi:putative methionine-R-sulfoxide reductase with GAF domain
MVTNAVPVLAENGRDLLAVMSHDFLIESLQTEVLGFQVGVNGFAFLLDDDGHVIAHRNHPLDTNLPCAEEINITLAEQEPEVAAVQEQMLGGMAGLTRYTDAEGEMWLIAYDAVATTGWRLGMAIPQSEVIAPATAIIRQVVLAAVVLLGLSLPVSYLAAQYMTKPVRQLSHAAQTIETSIARDEQVKTLSTADLAHISGALELNQLVAIFGQMVNALQERVKELDTLYAIGQTMTGNLDYESALSSVLAAVRQVVEYDAAEISVVEGEYLRVYAWRGQQGMRDTTGKKYRIGRGLTGRIAQTKQAVYEARVEQETAADSSLTLASGIYSAEQAAQPQKLTIRSFLGIPLLIGERLVGVITLVHHEADHFTQTDQRQLNKLAAQASIAIDNALRVRARENELKEQIRTLQVRIEDVSRSQGETGMDAALLQDLRAQARALRLRKKE